MIKLSLKLEVSLGKILLGVAGFSAAICAYKLYSTKKSKKNTSSDIIPSDSNISAKINEQELSQSTKNKATSSSNVNEAKNSCKLSEGRKNNDADDDTQISKTSLVSNFNSNECCENMESVGEERLTQETKFCAIQSKPASTKRQDVTNGVISENSVV